MSKKRTTLYALTAFAVLVASVAVAGPAGSNLEESGTTGRTADVKLAQPDWRNTPLLPAAIAIGAAETRRVAAQYASELTPSADGTVDLSLTTLIDLTLRNNLDIRVSSYQPALSVEAVRQQEAIFDPLLRFTLSLFSTTNPTAASLDGADVLSVDQQDWNLAGQRLLPWGGSGSVSFNNGRQKSNSRFATLNPSFDSSLSFQVTQPLLRDFGRDMTWRNINIANNDRQASAQQFRQQVMGTITAAISAYWDLYGRLQSVEVRKESLRLANDLLGINRIRVEVGTMAPLEISTAEAEVARNEEFLIQVEHDARTAMDTILQFINTPPSSNLWSATLRPVDTPPKADEKAIDVDVAIASALENRPELKRHLLQLDNDRIRRDYAKNQLKPGLSLQASYGLSGLGGTQLAGVGGDGGMIEAIKGGYSDSLDQLVSFDFDTWRLAATVDLPVFNQAAEASHAQAHLSYLRDEDALEAERQAIAVEVRRLVRAAQTNRKSMDAAAVTRRLQEQRLDAEEKKFEHGLSTNFQVSQAQKDLTEARTNEVIASTTYRRALATLEAAMGTVLDTYGITIDDQSGH